MIFQQLLFSRHLDEDEKILYVGHKHWIEIVRVLFKVSFFGIAFPWLLYVFLGIPPLFWFAVVTTVITYIRLLYVLIDWYFDAILVTSASLIFITWHGLFHQESTRISYESVESISLETEGVLATIFGFGKIAIERDGAEEIEMEYIRNPKRLELEIMRGKESFEEKTTSENTEALKEILSQLVAEHIKKNGWKRK